MTTNLHFTRYEEWIAQWDLLSLPEALVLSRIRQWGNDGCYETYENIGKKLKLDRRTVIRSVMSLQEKDLIIIRRVSHKKRIIVFNNQCTHLPLFDSKKVTHRHLFKKESSKISDTQTPHGVTESPILVSERHHIISNKTIDKKTEEKILLTADLMKPNSKLSTLQKENNRQKLLAQLEDMK